MNQLLLGCLLTLAPANDQRPNVLFILADDLGYADVGCYGCKDTKTPHIDQLAKEGTRFTDFYANACVCTPTRCGFLTGRYQQRIGGLEWALYTGMNRLGLPPQEKTIARLVQDKGYYTALAGKWHLGYTKDRTPNHHGFGRFFGLHSGYHNYLTHRDRLGEIDLFLDTKRVEMEGHSTDLITQHALMFMDEAKGKPFFLFVSYNAPHWPYQDPKGPKEEIKDKEWQKGTRETYIKMVEHLDDNIGTLMAGLKKRGLDDNTLVVFTSDNGGEPISKHEPLSKGKYDLWEGGIRVPCIARWPGKIPADKVTGQVGITMDWSATLLNLAGAVPPKDRALDGMDLLPILEGKQKEQPRTLFWRRVDEHLNKTHRAVRHEQWKFIDSQKGESFLYDLSRDPGEKENLAEKFKDRAKELKEKIDRWESDVDPPLYDQSGDQRIK